MRILTSLLFTVSISVVFGSIRADFNNDGFTDLAIGAPSETVDGALRAGAVYVIYGSPAGLAAPAGGGTVQLWHLNVTGVPGTAEAEDRFGSALAAGDFNNDGRTDLAIGIPGKHASYQRISDSVRIEGVGSVLVIYGGPAGLTTSHPTTPPPSQVASTYRIGPDGLAIISTRLCDSCVWVQGFGGSLAAGDFDGDGATDLAVGSPQSRVDNEFLSASIDGAGVVMIYYGSPATPLTSSVRRVVLTQEGRAPGTTTTERSEANDRFGAALAAADFNRDGRTDLAIGVPNESIATTFGAGMVQLVYGCRSEMTNCRRELVHQNTDGIAGTAEMGDLFGFSLTTGDFNGDGYADLVIGVPYEDVGTATDAGAVHVIPGFSGGLSYYDSQLWTQNAIFGSNPGYYDGSSSESGDRFGYSVAAGDFNGDGRMDLAVGVPYEDVVSDRSGAWANLVDAGEVDVIYGSGLGLSLTVRAAQMWHQDVMNVEGAAEAADMFGLAVAAGDFNADGRFDLVVGTPADRTGLVRAGAANVIYGSGTNFGLSSSGDQIWHQDVANFPGIGEVEDKFGSVLR